LLGATDLENREINLLFLLTNFYRAAVNLRAGRATSLMRRVPMWMSVGIEGFFLGEGAGADYWSQ